MQHYKNILPDLQAPVLAGHYTCLLSCTSRPDKGPPFPKSASTYEGNFTRLITHYRTFVKMEFSKDSLEDILLQTEDLTTNILNSRDPPTLNLKSRDPPNLNLVSGPEPVTSLASNTPHSNFNTSPYFQD